MTINDRRLRADADREGIHKLVVGAVVHDRGRVLILRRSATDEFLPGIEELPSGGQERGEELLDSLARELAEEIGWHGPVAIDPTFVTHFDYLSGSGRKVRQYTFAVPYDGRPITLSPEHTAYRWISPADLDGSDVTPETARTIQAWTAHDGVRDGGR
jgi:8-oxo-dGTP diphosphatase